MFDFSVTSYKSGILSLFGKVCGSKTTATYYLACPSVINLTVRTTSQFLFDIISIVRELAVSFKLAIKFFTC
jgi:hypothetical protein